MQISPATVPAPLDSVIAPTFRPGEQPYRFFLSAVSNAQSKVQEALTLIDGPQPMHLTPRDYIAKSLDQARAGLELLVQASGHDAPRQALSANAAAIQTLQLAILEGALPFIPVSVEELAGLYRDAIGQIDTAIAHSTMMFAL